MEKAKCKTPIHLSRNVLLLTCSTYLHGNLRKVSLRKLRKGGGKENVEPTRTVNKSLLRHDLESVTQMQRIWQKQASCSWDVRENPNDSKSIQWL